MKSIGNAFKLFSLSLGIIGGITGIISFSGELTQAGVSSLLIVISIALISTVYSAIKRRTATVIGNINFPKYTIRVAKKSDLIGISSLQKSCYPDDAVPHSIYLEWFEKNPEGFFIFELTKTDSTGTESKELVGHFTFLAIKDSCMDIYRRGDMLETGITQSHLYSPSEKALMNNIYIESVIIKKEHRREVVFRLLSMLDSMVAHFCGILQESPSTDVQRHTYAVDNVYAMAATEDGIKTLKGMGFDSIILPNGKERLDKHDMFECTFDKFLASIRLREEMHEIRMLK